jgi:S-adenosylmethionine decarboxylase
MLKLNLVGIGPPGIFQYQRGHRFHYVYLIFIIKGEDNVMKPLGRHILAELYGCEFDVLNDIKKVESIMVNAALEAGAEIREFVFHKFSPQGVSGVVVISESHLAIHTWPELGYAAVDVFTCGDRVDPWDACNYLSESFCAAQISAQEIERGIIPAEVEKVAVNL